MCKCPPKVIFALWRCGLLVILSSDQSNISVEISTQYICMVRMVINLVGYGVLNCGDERFYLPHGKAYIS